MRFLPLCVSVFLFTNVVTAQEDKPAVEIVGLTAAPVEGESDNSATSNEASTEASGETTTESAPADVAPAEAATEQATAPEPVAEATPAPEAEEPKIYSASCGRMFLNYVRAQPKAKQTSDFELWWALNDEDYSRTKKNEFEYRKQKPEKLKEFQTKLSSQPETVYVQSYVTLGNYDFKKKGFPVTILTNKKTKFLANKDYWQNIMFSLKSVKVDGTIRASCAGWDFKPAAGQTVPNAVYYKITNLEKMKFVSVPEDKAQELMKQLSSNREAQMTYRFSKAKAALQPVPPNKGKALVVEAAAQEVILGRGDYAVSMKP